MSNIDSNEIPKWSQLAEFLEARFRALEMIEPIKSKITQNAQKSRSFHASVLDQNKTKYKDPVCALCEENHNLFACKKFGSKQPKERQDFVQSKGLCFNCLAPNHSVKNCKLSKSCQKCGRRHHTLLHYNKETIQGFLSTTENLYQNSDNIKSENRSQQSTSLGTETKIVSNFANENHQPNEVLLATALLKSRARNGCEHYIRALLDQGSQASFITEATSQLLGLKRSPVNGWVSGLGPGETRVKYMVSLHVESRQNPENSIQVDAYVLRSFSWLLPSRDVTSPNSLGVEDLFLADPGYATPSKIDLLLGAEAYSEILTEGLIKYPRGNLIAQNTIFGWILSGRVSKNTSTKERRVINMHLQIREDDLLKQFWELETEPNNILKKRLTKEEIKCEELYQSTTTRDYDGRYVVRLPFKKVKPDCEEGQFKELALKRFYSTERRLLRNKKHYDEYQKVLEEYISLNHMKAIDSHLEIEDSTAVYLPHHAVIREDKDTTKLRVVFDGSQKGVNNISLNDSLMIGPKLQQDLRHLLMRWRCGAIAIVADIVKMYRQVRVHEEDTKYQRILWRAHTNQPVQHFKLLTLTFGTACAPYLAVKSLQQVAKDEGHKYKIAAEKVSTDFYVDDLMTTCRSEEEAKLMYKEMNELLQRAGFQLQKWSSNCEVFLQYLNKENTNLDQSIHIKANDTLKVLGISWNRTTDQFEYTVNIGAVKDVITKRNVISDIARLYDPMGWIAPVIVKAKIYIQKLWRANLEWDDSIPEELLEEWLCFRSNLSNLTNIKIPRWMHLTENSHRELHAFADASRSAYAAVVYCRSIDAEGKVHVSLVTAKTKVSPIEKEVTIPRLELCGAVLAAKLLYEVSQILNIPKKDVYAWTDSAVVLAWLKGLPNRWTTFVSNRVSEIINIIEYDQWGHVATDMNPADCASRGLQSTELSCHQLWWNGPPWLQDIMVKSDKSDFFAHEEERVIKAYTTVKESETKFLWTRFSSLSKMLRILSRCKRFLTLTRLQAEEKIKIPKFITTDELENILLICIRQAQEIGFCEDVKEIKNRGCVRKKSVLHTLHPFFDKEGLLRVGGRIKFANARYGTRHPLIMPANSHLTQLIVRDAHEKTLHGGPQVMLNILRERYWIIRGRDQVKKCYRECVTCLRYSKINKTPLMGQLPEVRLKPSKAFKSTGVDYAGPINVRVSPGRGTRSYKGYIALFICMVTRAIHLEVVSELSAKGFIAAFRRFVSRRGRCQDLFSDNGTNFVGADKILSEMFNAAKSELPNEIATILNNEGTKWHFNPPHSPNFGGIWEAGVRSVKTHLRKVVGDSTLTYEELSTVLAQIEACLNSRPISQLSDNPDDLLPLTPGHFLVGEPLITIPDRDNTDDHITGIERWRLIQKMVNDFWKRWSREYLVLLSQRYKWTTNRTEPEINDIVIVKEDNVPPAKWILGKIIQKHTGKDNITRVVTIKCKNNFLKRPVSKLCFLPKSCSHEKK
ncbi:uncharacterized protein LOC125070100 [Vanessa atalanta]|uniref:uncharacterized protein LOC125070100 n=1 Tax=Vanessa atalanta TaxID=42275 RepID=UPI001FCD316A|nr:uncharacterized protein LOC125070100 [Vanessa atalanta]